MAKNDKGKDRGRDWSPWYLKSRDDIPRPKGKFRNLFPEMVPKPKNSDVQRAERGESSG